MQAFAADLEKLFNSLQAIDTELIVQACGHGQQSSRSGMLCSVCTVQVARCASQLGWQSALPPFWLPSLTGCSCCPCLLQAGAGGGVSASVAADDAAVNRFLLDLVR